MGFEARKLTGGRSMFMCQALPTTGHTGPRTVTAHAPCTNADDGEDDEDDEEDDAPPLPLLLLLPFLLDDDSDEEEEADDERVVDWRVSTWCGSPYMRRFGEACCAPRLPAANMVFAPQSKLSSAVLSLLFTAYFTEAAADGYRFTWARRSSRCLSMAAAKLNDDDDEPPLAGQDTPFPLVQFVSRPSRSTRGSLFVAAATASAADDDDDDNDDEDDDDHDKEDASKEDDEDEEAEAAAAAAAAAAVAVVVAGSTIASAESRTCVLLASHRNRTGWFTNRSQEWSDGSSDSSTCSLAVHSTAPDATS